MSPAAGIEAPEWLRHTWPSFLDEPEPEVIGTSTEEIGDVATVPRRAVNRAASCPLLDLPLEIRLYIYSLVHRARPIHPRDLAPWYPSPRPKRCALRGVGSDGDKGLSSGRPYAGLPSALLCSCSQVYCEARTIPFTENEFVFVPWFSSGLMAAKATLQGMRPWQRQAMRYVRLDLHGGGEEGTWRALCEAWTGLRGLRLWVDAGEDSKRIVDGLARMQALQRVEVVMGDGLTAEERMEWCQWVEGGLRRRQREVQVVCSEVSEDE
ncbi:hypothetical protein B0I35DRAFT_429198 [Stachybotrys elegans]|uniref:Uncharacterized protein n=1 Tax=Stachybotrys elegans TaxID=80388 RepID=A0A8K0SUV0_9HYPO|nr:hypothetical protein B0I35DRAFT_429198 [Stachybotrys elegans]